MYRLFAQFCAQMKLVGNVPIDLNSVDCDFAYCVQACLAAKRQRRKRTVAEFRAVSEKMMRLCPEWRHKRLFSVSVEDCEQLLSRCFCTERQRLKGYMILHGIFAFALKRRWCSYNPVDLMEKPYVEEAEIELLTWPQLRRLLRVARTGEHRACLSALALMLWAGIRPSEVSRLDWQHIDWQEQVVVVPAQHAKTGGCRHVHMEAVLRAVLGELPRQQSGSICPADWGRRWKRLRDAAGLVPWRQDVLRHCFASYHIKKWHDYARLQAEMGHRSADLLRTRYLSMRGISAKQATAFWRVGGL